jgi:hypothetical protein
MNKEVIKHTKTGTLLKVLDKANEPGINLSDLKEFIAKELEKIKFNVVTKKFEE